MQSCAFGHRNLPGTYCWVKKREKKSQVCEPYVELELNSIKKMCACIYLSIFTYTFIHTKISGRKN